MENSREVPKKIKMGLPYDPAIPLLGTHAKEMKTGPLKDSCTPTLIAALNPMAKVYTSVQSSVYTL